MTDTSQTAPAPSPASPDEPVPSGHLPDGHVAAPEDRGVDGPSPDRRSGGAPALGLGGSLRFWWTQLTSMRTALVLLFALAVAAIPGSVVPQRKVSPIAVDEFLAAHRTLGPLYDKVGLFAVYTSPWFAAIYLLLFLSLVGCIIPRVLVYARGLRSRPVPTPKNLSRLPAYDRRDLGDASGASGPDVLERAAAALKRSRYRVELKEGSVSAERGYLREAGNLVFHLSLLFVLFGVAVNGLYGYRGTTVVVVGDGFSNNLTQYDDFSAGAAFRDASLRPFSLLVRQFVVRFETGPVQTGAAREFSATVGVTDAPGEPTHTETLQVNHPLHVDGSLVHLIGHGYAPRVTVRDAEGNVAFAGPVVFLPQDGNFTSVGVIKVPDARPERLAFQGFFLPSAVVDASGPHSVFPDAVDPELFLTGYYGPPRVETGRPQSVYELDKTGLTQFRNPAGTDVLRLKLDPGQSYALPGGKGSITFDGWSRWVKLQVGDAPGALVVLVSIGFAVAGLCLSLFVRPRRVWVRVRPRPGGFLVEVAGLDRADARSGLGEDVQSLAAELAWTPPSEEADRG